MNASREIEDLRELVDHFVSDENRTFAEPWQSRAFVPALSERGMFSLREFQAALIGRITSFEKGQCIGGTADYYTCWIEVLEDLEDLEDLLSQKDLLPSDHLSLLERDVVEDAESRKVHQRMTSRGENGQLRISPLLVDPALI
jgi:nitrile hydratase accessory protein